MAYRDLLTWQYRQKPKAKATIDVLENTYEGIKETALALPEVLSIERATGVNLDLVGKHVGQSRNIRYIEKKPYFGFTQTRQAKGFLTSRKAGGQFAKFRETSYADYQLRDEDFRFLIKCRITKNYQDGTMRGLVHALRFIFGKGVWAYDWHDMTVDIRFSEKHIGTFRLDMVRQLDLLPRPAGVKYLFKLQHPLDLKKVNWRFGFRGARFAKGWAEQGKWYSKARAETTPFLLELIQSIHAKAYLEETETGTYLITPIVSDSQLMNKVKNLTIHGN